MGPLDLAFDVLKAPAQWRDKGGKKRRGVPPLPGREWERGVLSSNLDLGDIFEEGANIPNNFDRNPAEAMSVDHVARKKPTSARWGGTRKNPKTYDPAGEETDIFEYNSDTGEWEATKPETVTAPEFTMTDRESWPPSTVLGPVSSKPTGRRSLTGVGKRKIMGKLGLKPDATINLPPQKALPPPQEPEVEEDSPSGLSNWIRKPLDPLYAAWERLFNQSKEEPEQISNQ